MKKLFRIGLPIIMAVILLLVLGWYFFIYDCSFTRDIFMSGARFFEEKGNHKVAATFYDLAYRQTADNEDVAIELARYHIKFGNYTQAELTLSSAIADGGNENLYVALCRTYLEQDKLLDAVSLLDNITNPKIKEKIDAMRPAAPKASLEPGFYSQYMSVALTAEDGTIYATADGEYPTKLEPPYSEPFSLVDGENTIYTLAISDDGLVSPLAIYGYTIGGVIEKVEFADSQMEKAIREALSADENKVLFTNDLWKITSFTMPEGTKNFDDLAKMVFLEELTIESGPAGEINKLSGLSNLHTLNVNQTPVSSEDIQAIGKLNKLESLSLTGCGISTLSGLENLQKLSVLNLTKNTIRDLSPLSSYEKLREISIQNNVVMSLEPLKANAGLEILNASYNALTDASPVSELTALKTVFLNNNSLTGVPDVSKLKNLQELSLAFNQLTDISPAAKCESLQKLNISDNQISSIHTLHSLVNLSEFDFSNNQVTELPKLPKESALVTIKGNQNQLKDLSPLKGLSNLNKVFVDYNPDINNVDILADCPRLVEVNAYGTAVKEAKKLIDLSIVVNFDPTKKD